MADAKITDLSANTTPASTDLGVIVDDPGGTPATQKATLGNIITKGHGLSDGIVKVASSTMATATAGTDYVTGSSTNTLTNKTFDANGTGNSLSNVEVADFAGSAIVTEAEGLASSDNDTSLPTTAAVIDYIDNLPSTDLEDLPSNDTLDGTEEFVLIQSASPVLLLLSALVTYIASATKTLTNTTFNANGTGNSLSNVEVADFASGVVDTDLSSVSGSDDTIPSAKATKAALDLKAPLASPTFTGTVTLPTGLTGVLRADSGVVSTDSDVTDIVAAASTIAAGKVELATTAETETGTDTARAVTPDGLHDMSTLAGAAWFLDEDDMSSNSATKTASQQSIKAYVDANAGGASELDDLDDVTITDPQEDEILAYNGSAWVNATNTGGSGIANVVEDTSPQLGGNLDLNNFTVGDADAADLTKLSELTATSTELNYVDGVTSAIQTQLDAKMTASSTNTLTNKTFDANGTGNSITNIEVADFASGVVDTDLSSVSGSDDTLPSAKATKTALDDKVGKSTDSVITGSGTTFGLSVQSSTASQGKAAMGAAALINAIIGVFDNSGDSAPMAFINKSGFHFAAANSAADVSLIRTEANVIAMGSGDKIQQNAAPTTGDDLTNKTYADGLITTHAAVTATHGATGAVVGTTNTQTLTNKRITPRTGTTTSSATPTINTDNVDFYSLTAQATDITSFTTNLSGTPTENQPLSIAITGTAARAITWGASFENGPATLPTTTVTTQRLDVHFRWNSVTSKWRCMASGSA